MKKPLVAVLCTALGAVLIGGSILGYSIWSRSRVQISVESVSVLQGYWGDNNSTYGVVTTDMTQEVFLKSDMVVDEVLVQEGDTVTVGTPLIQYDTTLINLDLDVLAFIDKNITVNIIKDGIASKKTLTPPKRIVNVAKCPNPRCISNVEEGVNYEFALTDDKGTYRCIYCETKIK